jgi:tetratricopeptide (TPR) repeat protein
MIQLCFPPDSLSSRLFYTIQSGSFLDVDDARKQFVIISQKLDRKDLGNLRIERIGEFYSVRIGRFEDYGSADKFLEGNKSQLEKAIILKAFLKDERIVNLYQDPPSENTGTRIAGNINKDTMKDDSIKKSYNPEAGYDLEFKLGYFDKHIEALKIFKRAVSINPDHAEAHYNLGVAYGNLDMHLESIEAFKQAVYLDPDHERAYCNLGIAYGEISVYKKAIEAFKQAIELNPDNADLFLNLGITYGKSGMYKESADALKEAVRIAPDYADAHYNLGFAYLALNDKNSAMNEYKILKDLDAEFANKLFKEIFGLDSFKEE